MLEPPGPEHKSLTQLLKMLKSVNYLINNQATNLFRRQSIDSFRTLKGILPKDTLQEFQKERKKELVKEEKKAPLPKSKSNKELRKKPF